MPSTELAGSIAQALCQRANLQQEKRLTDELAEPAHGYAINVVVIIGQTPEDPHRQRSFEQYRKVAVKGHRVIVDLQLPAGCNPGSTSHFVPESRSAFCVVIYPIVRACESIELTTDVDDVGVAAIDLPDRLQVGAATEKWDRQIDSLPRLSQISIEVQARERVSNLPATR